MHGTGCWLGHDDPAPVRRHGGPARASAVSTPSSVWDTVEREGVQHLDHRGRRIRQAAAAGPRRRADRWDLSSLRLMVSSGAMFSADVKQGLIAHLPALAIADVLGSTEGGHGHVHHHEGHAEERDRQVLAEPDHEGLHRRRPRGASPARARSAWWPTAGSSPIGYYKDPEKSARDVPRGERRPLLASPATWRRSPPTARSCCSAGVRTASTPAARRSSPKRSRRPSKLHPAVEDALVFGVPDDRFGQRVVGVVSLQPRRTAAGPRRSSPTPASGWPATSCRRRSASSRGAARTERQGRLSRRTRVVRVTAQG